MSSDCVGCGTTAPPPLPKDTPKLPPPITIPLPPSVLAQQRAVEAAAAGKIGAGGRVVIPRAADGITARPPAVVRARNSLANTAAATPGFGAKSVMERLANAPAMQQLALNNKATTSAAAASAAGAAGRALHQPPPPPATVAEAATAAGVSSAAMGLNQAALNGAEKPSEYFEGLWKKHTLHTDGLKNDLQTKLQESMNQIKALDIKNLTKDGAFSGFDRNIDASQLTAQDVQNAEYMKTEGLSIPDADIVDIPSSEFMSKRLADHQAKFEAATAAALQAVNRQAGSQPAGAQAGSQPAGAQAGHPSAGAQAGSQPAKAAPFTPAQAMQINQNLKTQEFKDRRARYSEQKRAQMNLPGSNTATAATAANAASAAASAPHPTSLPIKSAAGYTPLGSTAPTTVPPIGFGAANSLPGMMAGGMQGFGGQLNDMTSQLKEKVAKSSPELTQQAELVQGLAAQLQNWNALANKMGSLQTYMGVFGKHVRLMLGVQDDARHYSVQHYRGPLLTLLDNDTVKWYRRNDIAQSFINAGCNMTWQGSAPATSENNERGKRFQLEWRDVVVDSQQRPIAIGTSWNATSQRHNMAIARFAQDGKTLDASFYSDPSVPGVGAFKAMCFKPKVVAFRS